MTHSTAGAGTGLKKHTADAGVSNLLSLHILVDQCKSMISVSLDLAVFLLAPSLPPSLQARGLRIWHGGRWRMVACPDTASGDDNDHRLCPVGARLRCLKLRRAIRLPRLPLVVGSAVGIPGALPCWNGPPPICARGRCASDLVRLYNLARPKLPDLSKVGIVRCRCWLPQRSSRRFYWTCRGYADDLVWLARMVPRRTACGISADRGRHVLMSIAVFGGVGLVTPETVRLFLIGLPVLLAGTLLGWALYGKLDEAWFRRIVLALLLISGTMLLMTGR